MERPFDDQRFLGGMGEALHRVRIGRLGRGDGQGARILFQIERVLDHVVLEALPAQCSCRKFPIERQLHNGRSQRRRGRPGMPGERAHAI